MYRQGARQHCPEQQGLDSGAAISAAGDLCSAFAAEWDVARRRLPDQPATLRTKDRTFTPRQGCHQRQASRPFQCIACDGHIQAGSAMRSVLFARMRSTSKVEGSTNLLGAIHDGANVRSSTPCCRIGLGIVLASNAL